MRVNLTGERVGDGDSYHRCFGAQHNANVTVAAMRDGVAEEIIQYQPQVIG